MRARCGLLGGHVAKRGRFGRHDPFGEPRFVRSPDLRAAGVANSTGDPCRRSSIDVGSDASAPSHDGQTPTPRVRRGTRAPIPARAATGRWTVSIDLHGGGFNWRLEPAIGPGNILYLLHPPRSANVGGSIVAISPNGQVGQGWPVELTRPGAHFRMVDVGADGTVYALAVEPEGSDRSSATIVAMAPDSTVLWTTTIVVP